MRCCTNEDLGIKHNRLQKKIALAIKSSVFEGIFVKKIFKNIKIYANICKKIFLSNFFC